ncbi:NAD-dependent epimerase/dehydratase [Candidatus Filomicrobium marinum]|uniref:NAD-dependent epimerase/dehydratase n=2 Tax=Filomicrobium TaxID=119044 RepID=A0A0D6JB37_9HYPH|nr:MULTISPECIES: NAD(P)H-binding protein [Filomicrobium]MCV0368600.1 NAD(P)H-binding protein [Filomicrobium sp.]CFX01117.1 NAD-dependent epimerase/dehydratase [Candidatus Filomicrobium marinum]CPR15388.1 NAD-dependent epimerase/dehydratase [Candidatus Filomicrobium marinum]SDO65972.1 Putative NADH-flavin reductase [Filomicrobium insigne]
MASLLIIGASRGIGLETAKAALAAGHRVRAFARSASNIPLSDKNLEKFPGDALSANDVARALDDVDVVVQVLGADIGPGTILGGTTLFSDSTRILVDAMQKSDVKRLICVTGFGAGDSRDALGPLYRLAFTFTLRRIYDDKDVQEQIIKASDLDWTIVRPGLLRDGRATGLYRALTDPKDWQLTTIRRTDVARFLIDEVEQNAFSHKTPVLIS